MIVPLGRQWRKRIRRTQIIHSAAVPDKVDHDTAKHNLTLEGVKFVRASTYLDMYAIHATDSLEGLDWCTANASE